MEVGKLELDPRGVTPGQPKFNASTGERATSLPTAQKRVPEARRITRASLNDESVRVALVSAIMVAFLFSGGLFGWLGVSAWNSASSESTGLVQASADPPASLIPTSGTSDGRSVAW